ncbi:MAG: NADPH:quinone reductase [Pyrinomonadaceae bacterium]
MKAIVVRGFGGSDVMSLEEIPTPEPGAAQVLVRIEAAGVNPVDTYIRSGIHAVRPNLPYTPGKDAAGVVEKTGGSVKEVKPGERVFLSGAVTGTYAEFALCEAGQFHRLPDNVSFEEGAGVFVPYATAFRALFQKAKGRKGETVLVHGASGGVGLASIQWAKNAGLKVIGTAGSDEGKELVKDQGADLVFDHSADNYLQKIREATGGSGVEIILEMLANVNLEKDFDILKMFGRITVIGNRGSLDFNPRLAMTKDASIFGMSLFNAPADEMLEINENIFKGLSEGFLKPVVGSRIPLAEAARAHRNVIENKAFGKIVLIP